jgi:tetraacyldisaccharide 4'-kinase
VIARRLVDGWESGFAPGARLALGVATVGYRALLAARDLGYATGAARPRAVGVPVVSIGNVTVGGTGKTPAVELAAHTLIALGRRPAVLSRGYGRTSRGIQVVADTASIRLDVEEAGDEPFLLARRLPSVPVIVGANRHDAARHAVARFGVTALVLDDGFQHRTLCKDLEIVMVRARRPWGNGRLLPSGPLREPLAGLRRADLVVTTGVDDSIEAAPAVEAVRTAAPDVPVLAARYEPTECWQSPDMRFLPPAGLTGRRLLAFSGIGTPQGFERTLRELGVMIGDVATYRDHHWYSRADLTALDARARRVGADGLVTTEKDWIRLRGLPPTRAPLYVLGVTLRLVAGEATWRRAFERMCSTR